MNIQNNIIKHYLKNVYFITGTAYAGKSTMCKLLSKKFNMTHCEENYNSDTIFSLVDEINQPNLNYFNSKIDWQEFLNRTPDEYDKWLRGNDYELSGFEVAELIRLSQDRKVIVDTNIPIEILKEIADYHQIAVMLTSKQISVENFFDREDPEKLFLKEQILNGPTPQKTMTNFKNILSKAHDSRYNQFIDCGCYTILRENTHLDTKEETIDKLVRHFKFNI